ncbi:MAG: serine/threonine-protein kinase [Burkholderiaceae bacterium]
MGSQKNAALPDGLELHGYRIVRRIASGGFSIVYLAEDGKGVQYAIKEYLPSNLVTRKEGELVPVVESKHQATFRNGLKCFFEEGRTLARVFHPNVVRVVNFFRAHETVYMVMAFEQGRSLQEIVLRHRKAHRDAAAAEAEKSTRLRRGKGAEGTRRGRAGAAAAALAEVEQAQGMVPERHVLHVFNLVMNGLREVHANRLLHLDLKPANIYLRMDGTPLLLDFGAARRALDDDLPKLFPMYTPGFAAPELYRRDSSLGPWTDIYGLGTSMYACMAGKPPQPADKRQTEDELLDAIDQLSDAYSQALLDIVVWCVKLDPVERPQSVFALQRALRAIEVPPIPKARWPRWLNWLGRHGGDTDNHQHSLMLPNG